MIKEERHWAYNFLSLSILEAKNKINGNNIVV